MGTLRSTIDDLTAKRAVEVKELAASAPMVMFTWESSPSCKKALNLCEVAGVTPKVVRLDDPWDKGNIKRAALGRN